MTDPDDSLAQFAAAFLANYAANDVPPFTLAPAQDEYPGLTAEAAALLRAVDAGGAPAFVTENLRRIALENGIATDPGTTPDGIVAALRANAQAAAAKPADGHG